MLRRSLFFSLAIAAGMTVACRTNPNNSDQPAAGAKPVEPSSAPTGTTTGDPWANTRPSAPATGATTGTTDTTRSSGTTTTDTPPSTSAAMGATTGAAAATGTSDTTTPSSTTSSDAGVSTTRTTPTTGSDTWEPSRPAPSTQP